MNCGVNNGGWNPPFVTVHDIVAKDLASAVKTSNTPFLACSAFTAMFEKYGNEHSIPPIMLAAFAMQVCALPQEDVGLFLTMLQESSCNANTVGGAGEQGLMQLTQDKCGGAPGGNCRDPVSFTFHSSRAFELTMHSRISTSVRVPSTSRVSSTATAVTSCFPSVLTTGGRGA